MSTEEVITGLNNAQQYAALAAKVASLALPLSPVGAYIELGSGFLALASQVVAQGTAGDLPELATLNAEEILILAADAQAQAQADAARREAVATPPAT